MDTSSDHQPIIAFIPSDSSTCINSEDIVSNYSHKKFNVTTKTIQTFSHKVDNMVSELHDKRITQPLVIDNMMAASNFSNFHKEFAELHDNSF